MEKWDRNEWQGRRKKQVEDSSKIIYYAFILLISYLVLNGIIDYFRFWKLSQ